MISGHQVYEKTYTHVHIYTNGVAGGGVGWGRGWERKRQRDMGGGVGSLDPHKYLNANLYSCLLYVRHKKRSVCLPYLTRNVMT